MALSLTHFLRLEKCGAAAAASLFLAGLAFAAPASVEHVVKIKGMVFVPAAVHVSKGEKITWVNEDIVVHAVKTVSAKKPWQSKDIQPHESWSQTVEVETSYICPYHPTMTGQIVIDHPGIP